MISVRPGKDEKALQKFLKELPNRLDKMMAELTYQAAAHTRDGILARLPKGSDYRDYRDAVKVYEVASTGTHQFAHAVLLKPKTSEIKQAIKSNSIIYVRPTRRLTPVSPDILVLDQYGPWTLDSLPFKPKTSQATIVTKKVGAREYETTKKRNQRDRYRYAPMLARYGHRLAYRKRSEDKELLDRSIPPMVLEAMKLEFGDDGGKVKPSWKPAIMEFVRSTLPSLSRSHSDLKRTLSDTKFQRWARWPSKGDGKISGTELRNTDAFVKRLGLRL